MIGTFAGESAILQPPEDRYRDAFDHNGIVVRIELDRLLLLEGRAVARQSATVAVPDRRFRQSALPSSEVDAPLGSAWSAVAREDDEVAGCQVAVLIRSNDKPGVLRTVVGRGWNFDRGVVQLRAVVGDP